MDSRAIVREDIGFYIIGVYLLESLYRIHVLLVDSKC